VLERALCDAVEIGRIDQGAPARAAQTIPPSTRRLVWHRDHGRCIVPGCRSTIHGEVHHIHFRSDGGGHDPANLAVLCGACHDRVHQGTLLIRGTAPDGLTFLHGDGRPFGAPPPNIDPRRRADAISALVNLGFRKKPSTRAVDLADAHVGADAPLDELIRQAIRTVRRLS
jgi:hypothetical protein